MSLPPAWNKSTLGKGGNSVLNAVPLLESGGQMVSFLMSNFGGAGTVGALAEIAAKSTLFQGRYIGDIMVLLFSQPSPIVQSLGAGGGSAVSALASAAVSAPVVSGARLNTAASMLPNFFAFVFRINPSVHSRVETRARNTSLTKGGYLTQYWSAGMKVMTFTGNNGSMTPPDSSTDMESFNIRETVQYANFLQLRQFYETANQDVGLFFLGRFVQGVLSEFSFSEDANNPYTINYTFKFEAYPEYPELK